MSAAVPSLARSLLVVAVLVGGAPTVAAAQPREVDPALLARQRELFDRANALYDQQKLAEAEAAYLEAWKLRHSFDVAGNLGNLEYDLKKWTKAAELLAFAVAELPAGTKPTVRDALLARLVEVEREVGKLRVRVDRGGADVLIDGKSIASRAGTTREGNAWSSIYVEPGPHVVEATLDGSEPARVEVTVAKGSVEEVSLALVERGANRTVWIAGAAVTGAAVIVGAALAGASVAAQSRASSVAGMVPKDAPCPAGGVGATGTCATLRSDIDSHATLGNAAIASFVVAGAAGAATLVYALAAKPRPRGAGAATSVVIAPMAFARAGALLLRASF